MMNYQSSEISVKVNNYFHFCMLHTSIFDSQRSNVSMLFGLLCTSVRMYGQGQVCANKLQRSGLVIGCRTDRVLRARSMWVMYITYACCAHRFQRIDALTYQSYFVCLAYLHVYTRWDMSSQMNVVEKKRVYHSTEISFKVRKILTIGYWTNHFFEKRRSNLLLFCCFFLQTCFCKRAWFCSPFSDTNIF